MPITRTFNQTIEKIRPSDLVSKYHRTYETLLVTFNHKAILHLVAMKFLVTLPDYQLSSCNGKLRLYFVSESPEILVFESPIGAPGTVAFLEEVIYAFSIKNVVMYGSAGVLDKEITEGKLIVPTSSYRDEGTSYHYAPSADFITINHHQEVARWLSEAHIDYVSGPVWTTDAFYRETDSLIKRRRNQGCLAVEMELSAVQAMADFRGLALFNFLYSADNLDASQWEPRLIGHTPLDDRLKFFAVALMIARRVNDQNGALNR